MKALVKVANLADKAAKKTKVDSYLQLMAERRKAKAKAMRPAQPIKSTFLGSAVKKLRTAFPQA